MTVIETENVSLKLKDGGKDKEILNNISLKVNKGEIYGLVGNNGAGKTSLLRIISGLTVTHTGKVRLLDQEDLSVGRKSVGIAMDSLAMDESMSAIRYLQSMGFMYGLSSRTDYSELLNRVGLQSAGNKKIAKYSLGMKRRLAIAAALVGNPEILIMDEPFNGIDTNGMMEIRLLFQQLAAEGITILITSHIIPELMKLSTTYGVMYQGRLVQQYTNDDLEHITGRKLVMQTKNPYLLIENIHSKVGDYYCNSEMNGHVTVYGDVDVNKLKSLPEYYDSEAGINEVKMNAEDILLWRMNGYEV